MQEQKRLKLDMIKLTLAKNYINKTDVQAEPVRFHHGTPIKHFGPTFDDIFDKEDLNWWAQEEAKAEYNFPKLPFDPKADAQLGYGAR